MAGIKVQISLNLDQINEIKVLLSNRKTNLENWILARHTSEEEKENCQVELGVVNDLINIFF